MCLFETKADSAERYRNHQNNQTESDFDLIEDARYAAPQKL